MKDIKRIAYEKYKLNWMIDHGYTLNDLIYSLSEYMEDSYETLPQSYLDWEDDSGFGGEIWVSFDEFIENEYQDEGYMEFLTVGEYEEYLKDLEED